MNAHLFRNGPVLVLISIVSISYKLRIGIYVQKS